jgi:general secretion pathway protein L
MNTLLLNTSDRCYYQFDDSFNLQQVEIDLDINNKNIFIIDNAINIVSVAMPLKQDKQIEKALPFAIEESISSDLENTHIKYIGKEAGHAYAAIADKNLVSTFSEDQSVSAISYLPACIPTNPSSIEVVLIESLAMVKIDKLNSYSLPISFLESSLAAILDTNKDIKIINICELSPGKKGAVDDLLLAQLENLDIEIKKVNPQIIAEALDNADVKKTSLLTGEFKRVNKQSNAKFSKFKGVLILLTSLVFIVFFIAQIYMAQTESKARAVQQASMEFYKQLFPNEVVRKRLMKRQFNDYIKNSAASGQGGGTFTALLGDTASEINAFKGIEYSSIKYSEKNQQLEISLICSSVNQLEKIKQKLTDKGLQVDIASANQSGNVVKGVIKVKSNG